MPHVSLIHCVLYLLFGQVSTTSSNSRFRLRVLRRVWSPWKGMFLRIHLTPPYFRYLPNFLSPSLPLLLLLRKLGWWLHNYSRSQGHLPHENLWLIWASPWRWRDSDPDRWTAGVALSQHRFEGWVVFLYLLHFVSCPTKCLSFVVIRVYRLLPRIYCSHPGIKQTWQIWRLSKKCSGQTLFKW